MAGELPVPDTTRFAVGESRSGHSLLVAGIALGAALLLYSAYSFCFVHLANVTKYRELTEAIFVLLVTTSIIISTAHGPFRSITTNDARWMHPQARSVSTVNAD